MMNQTNSEENATTDVQTAEPHRENWTVSNMAVHIFLPLAGLVFLWNRKDILTKIWLQLDRNCVSVFCPSFSKREKLLKWAGGRLPSTWSSQSKTLSGGVGELFFDGSLLCTLINSAVPGACPNPHRHWRKPPIHAQAIAYKYLGVVPIFTETDLSGDFTTALERNFIHYLNELQQAIDKLQESRSYSSVPSCEYIARGMGLYTGEQYRKTEFYIYPNPHSRRNSDSSVIIQIRGPYGNFGKAVIPQFHGKMFPKKMNKFKKDFLNNFSFKKMIRYHEKTFGDNMIIDVKMEEDRAKVTYVPKNYGIYEINLIANGELLKGCPFNVNVLSNTSGVEENLEDDQIEEQINNKKRKIISKTIDFIDKQMPMEDLKKLKKKLKITDHEPSFKEVVDEVTKNALIVNEQEKLLIKNAQESPKKLIREEKIVEESEEDEEILPNVTDITIDHSEQNEMLPLDSLDYNEETKHEHERANSSIPDETIDNSVVNNADYKKTLPANKHDEPSNCCANPADKQNINKVAIPDVFTQGAIVQPKSALFSSEQVEKLTNQLANHVVEDLNNNSVHAQITLIPPRFFQMPERERPESRKPTNGTPKAPSPVCEHIVPEGDDFRRLPLAEKRKVFRKKSPMLSEIKSQNSSFSSENADGSMSSDKWEKLEKMSILYVLDSLKQSDQELSLSSTVSLPNFPSFEPDEISKRKVKEKRDFFEKISSRSSSSLSTAHSDVGPSPRKSQKATEYEKLIWSTPNSESPQNSLRNQSSEIRKSADDILSMTECLGYGSKKYVSMDNSLDTCTMTSIEDRKKMLLKQNYENDKREMQKLRKSRSSISLTKGNDNVKGANINEVSKNIIEKDKNRSSIVLEKIRQFDSGITSKTELETHPIKQNLSKAKSVNVILNDLKKASDPESFKVKSHFKKAIKYFKNLEEKSTGTKSKSRENFENARRRFSLEFPKIKKKDKRGGSLNLQKVSERFRINNLYNDVFGNRRGSFRGTPNRKAVLEAFKTFSKIEKTQYNDDETEDEIKYNFFKNSRKKQRKSIRSIFDVNY